MDLSSYPAWSMDGNRWDAGTDISEVRRRTISLFMEAGVIVCTLTARGRESGAVILRRY